MKTVGVEEVLALLVALDATLGAPDPLPGDPPEETLALVAVGGRGGGPQHEVVRRGARDLVDQRLQRLLVHVQLLRIHSGLVKIIPGRKNILTYKLLVI